MNKTRVFVYADGVRIKMGMYGFWILIFVRQVKIWNIFKCYEFIYMKDGKTKKVKTFRLGYLKKAIMEADIIDVTKTTSEG